MLGLHCATGVVLDMGYLYYDMAGSLHPVSGWKEDIHRRASEMSLLRLGLVFVRHFVALKGLLVLVSAVWSQY